jgi:hypothetical protein
MTEEDKDPTCFNCGAVVDEDSFCYGCSMYICDECDVNMGTHGEHLPEDHLQEPISFEKEFDKCSG